MAARGSLVLLVDQHLAPVVQHDGVVVGMTHGTSGKHAGIPAHLLPDQLFRRRAALDQFVVMELSNHHPFSLPANGHAGRM